MSMFPLPFAPRRIVIGANAHQEIAAWIGSRRPDLEIRGARMVDVTQADLEWAEAYVGFRRPPSASSLGKVRWVHCTGAGVDAWMSPEIDRGVLLTRTPESFGPAIAEWAVARVLAFQQQLPEVMRAQSERRWEPREIRPVAGTRALLVGTGDVGSAIARQFAALGIRVTGVSRTGRSEESAFAAVYPVDALPHLVADADWIVLTLPITPATRGLFSRDMLSRCRGAVLLNAGRGPVVEEAVLPEALAAGWLRGAALDVFEVEPLPTDSPLWSHPRVLVSPHISGLTTSDGAGAGFLECLEGLEAGVLPRWVVDRVRGY
ncbi:MAG: D-2-hydroxyacid dehydrogenase [Gemmatimonadaceae bacterium]|nr:D-2-hydroxyacid dehydrogenase [Gemmatimonadaceae bacterium]